MKPILRKILQHLDYDERNTNQNESTWKKGVETVSSAHDLEKLEILSVHDVEQNYNLNYIFSKLYMWTGAIYRNLIITVGSMGKSQRCHSSTRYTIHALSHTIPVAKLTRLSANSMRCESYEFELLSRHDFTFLGEFWPANSQAGGQQDPGNIT